MQDTYLAMYRRIGGQLPIAAPVAYAWRASSCGGAAARLSTLRTGAAVHLEVMSTRQGPSPVVLGGHTAVLMLGASKLAFLNTSALPALRC